MPRGKTNLADRQAETRERHGRGASILEPELVALDCKEAAAGSQLLAGQWEKRRMPFGTFRNWDPIQGTGAGSPRTQGTGIRIRGASPMLGK